MLICSKDNIRLEEDLLYNFNINLNIQRMIDVKTPILDKLIDTMDKERISFHTPGHKGKNTLIEWGKLVPYGDTTELSGLDNLHYPTGIIKESQDLAARTFGAKKTIYSVGGPTAGIYIALGTLTNPGDKILIQRESHKSVYKAAILNKLTTEYIYTNYNRKYQVYTGVNPRDIEKKLTDDPSIKVVVITYPNYYGICSNIEKIAEIVHKHNRLLLVDEAHGSHLVFSNKLPIPSLKAGADLVVQSTHKSLPSLTQTSMIHVGTDRVDIQKLCDISSLYQTTSPSYLFMASLELARAYMEGEGKERLNRNIDNIHELIESLKSIEKVKIFTGDENDRTIYDIDISKILLGIKGLTGSQLSNILMKDYGIYMEMSDFNYTLALATVMNEAGDFKELLKAIEAIAGKEFEGSNPCLVPNLPEPKIEMPIHEAYYSNKEEVDLVDSIGRISSSFITPYPPGVPVVCPGELITEKILDYIQLALDKGIEIIGLIGYNREKIQVVKEEGNDRY